MVDGGEGAPTLTYYFEENRVQALWESNWETFD